MARQALHQGHHHHSICPFAFLLADRDCCSNYLRELTAES